jgi:hypothetical protein
MVSWRAEPIPLGVEQAAARNAGGPAWPFRPPLRRRFGAMAAPFGPRALRAVVVAASLGHRVRSVVGAARTAVHRAGEQWTLLACAAPSRATEGPLARGRRRAEAGMSTAEYAVGTIAACGFAALLFKIVTSAEVRSMLSALIQKALKLAG